MKRKQIPLLVCACVTLGLSAVAQVTRADYERAASVRAKYQGLAVNIAERANWIGQTPRFWYRKAVKGGNEFRLVDAEAANKRPAFDHLKLAVSLSAAAGQKYEALKLPFQEITFVDNERALTFVAAGSMWRCELADYACKKTGAAPQGPFGFGGRRPPTDDEESPMEYENDVQDGIVLYPQQRGQGGQGGRGGFPGADPEQNFKTSPDGKWEALIQNFNVFVRAKGKTDAAPLSFDGSEGNYYTLQSIAWHKAFAAKNPWYDITRVGLYGTSAGGQNSTGGVLFHPEFYKAAVSNSGCHDNRMDKIWWNEQWMGWPLGPHYAASSNVDNAHRLQGKLLLVVPEMATNVDPASSWQVVNALIKANKKFDLLMVPGGGHGAGGTYYQRLLQDFFVHHLQGVEPPDWNKTATANGN